MTDEIRRALCKHNKDNPSLTQKQLQEWVHSNYGLQVSQATISNTVKRSLEYLSLAPERGDVKRHKPAKFPDLEKSLYEWILQYQEHVNMTGELIIEKAKKFMKDMYPVDTPDFTFSIGWLGKFKARYGIKNFRRFGESGSVEMEGMEDKLKSIRDKVDQFEMKDIFNMDETGLFFRLQPDHSLATMQLEGKKQDKERLTVAICCNEDGSEKLPLWIIGKYAKPRCFKNVNLNSLNCEYRANKRAWMTGVLFEEYVRQLDKKMVGRKILLIVDNCPAHPKIIEGLRNVELFFLPPNTTSKIQPCDAGIIRAFKMHYRRRFYRSLLEGYELGVPNPAKINVLDAMNLAISAWTMDVSANTIANCFRHCKLRSTDNMTFENSDEGGESTQELQNLIKELGYRNAMDVEDVLTHPEENVVAQLLTDEEIIESVIGINKDDIDEEDDESSTMEPPSRNEAIKAAITLNNFLLSYEKTTPEVLTMLRKIRDEIQGEIDFNKKQKTIDLSIASLTIGQQYYTGGTCRRMWYDGPDPTVHMLKGTSEGRAAEDRTIPLSIIAERTKLTVEDVEYLLMKSLSSQQQSPSIHQGVAAKSTLVEENPFTPVDNDPFINIFAPKPTSEASSSGDVSCQDTRRSTSGSAQFLGDKLVSWSSKKQKSTAISNTEAEYIAMSGCCAQILWMSTPDPSTLIYDTISFESSYFRLQLAFQIKERMSQKRRLFLTTDTMVDMNIPANDAPAEQAPAIAPPTRTDDQILPSSKWVPIGRVTAYLMYKSLRGILSSRLLWPY
ncbi:CENP-B homolog protein 2-like protein [Tanacetum coccineum]